MLTSADDLHSFFEQIDDLIRAWQAGQPAPEVCARYVLLHLSRRHPGQWLSGPRLRSKVGEDTPPPWLAELRLLSSHRQRQRLRSAQTVGSAWQQFFFRGVVLDSHEGLVGWLESRYSLRLRLDVPSPEEMLAAQCEGWRWVSLLPRREDQFRSHGRHRDACNFLLHDLEHAEKFFASPDGHRGQVRFFRHLRNTLDAFAQRWADDHQLRHEFHYLMSDMNSHPVHLLKYLKAIVLNAEIRRTQNPRPDQDDFWRALWANWGLREEVLDSALRLNDPAREREVDHIRLTEFFFQPLTPSWSPHVSTN